MKKILFVIPNLDTGGTTSSLNSLYLKLREKYDISVLSLSCRSNRNCYSFSEKLLSQDRGLSYLYSNFGDQHWVNKFFAVWFKILRAIFRFFGKEYGIVYGRRVVRQIEREFHFDYVVAFQEGDATKFSTIFKCANKIAWVHCDYSNYLAVSETEEKIYYSFKRIVCVSECTAGVFAKIYPSLADRTIAIHNLIDSARICHLAKEPIDDDLFVTSGIILLSVGRFTSVKRFREIPYAASVLKNKGIDFKWYILGPSDNSDERLLFATNAEKYGMKDSVKWLGEKFNPYPYFKVSSLYVCLSESEACPMVFKEAKLFGLPIVTTDFPSSYEFVNKDEGIITSLDKLPDAIAEIIDKIKRGLKVADVKDDSKMVLDILYKLFE